jgi:diaminopimelate decarboxylase
VHEIAGPGKRIADEPGRALVAHSTVTLYTVQSVKQNVSTWVGVDGGMSDNMRPMLYDARYEAMVVGRGGGPGQGGLVVHLTGKHCESSDVLIHDADLPDPQPGDLIAIPVTGAYGYAMANNYNGQPRPPVVFVKDGRARAVTRRETYDDLTARDL